MSASHADSSPNSPPYVLTRVTDDGNLTESLQRLAAAGCELLSNCAAASITIIAGGRAITMASTDDVAAGLDQSQYDAGDGPCLTAARDEVVVRIDDLAHDLRWPPYRQAGLRHGVASSLSVPLLIPDDEMFGALNVYGESVSGFSPEDERIARGFAMHAAVVTSNVIAYWEALGLSRNLSAAMEHRGVIEQAKGILMAVHSVTPDDAFGLLRQRSQAENRKLRDVAVDVVAETQRAAFT
jgi:GAF domain-containing protein